MVDDIKGFLDELKLLKKNIKSESTKQINKIALRKNAEKLGEKWFSEISAQIRGSQVIPEEKIDSYDKHFQELIKISAPSNLRTRYLSILDECIRSFRKDFILGLQGVTIKQSNAGVLNKIFEQLPNEDENNYIQEAVDCAKSQYYRAAAVLGWCAAIDRIHRKIEQIGFPTFNIISAQMSSEKKGRFKRFNNVQNVSTLSELREVFDNNVLWIVEGMQLIDSNQHTRLKSCFDLRCHSAHPGEAPITEYNLMSFFSDINEIVFKNDKFKITSIISIRTPQSILLQ